MGTTAEKAIPESLSHMYARQSGEAAKEKHGPMEEYDFRVRKGILRDDAHQRSKEKLPSNCSNTRAWE
jgi:hypothetical protein